MLHGGGVGAALPPAARVHVGAVLRDRVCTCGYWEFYVDEDEKYQASANRQKSLNFAPDCR